MSRLIFFLLYFSEGAPIGFIWWALPALLTQYGFSVTDAATVSAIATLPWSLKFIMAPFVDILSIKWISLKKQIFIYQSLMGVGIYFVPKGLETQELYWIIVPLIFHGCFAALQDICIDALAIKTIPESETGKINGIMQAGMLVGRSLFGGAGVFIAHKFGLDVLTYFLLTCIWISLIGLQRAKFQNQQKIAVEIPQYIKDFFFLLKSRRFWLLIGLTYFAGFSYNGISTVGSAVLSEMGASPLVHSLTYSLALPIFMAAGALLGGLLSDKNSNNKILSYSLLFSILTSVLVGGLIDLGVAVPTLIISYIVFYFFIGSTTASLYGYLMKNTSKEFAALEYSIFMAFVNLCDSTTSYAVGQILREHSYLVATITVGAICLFSFLFLRILRRGKLTPRQT